MIASAGFSELLFDEAGVELKRRKGTQTTHERESQRQHNLTCHVVYERGGQRTQSDMPGGDGRVAVPTD